MKSCNKNLLKSIEYSRMLMFLADKGDIQREDDGCGVVYGILRDCAYKIKEVAEHEIRNHINRGLWDGESQEMYESVATQNLHGRKANGSDFGHAKIA
ncbi:MAG: hypothetical protein GF398_10060 [Chitinivibrionales bacterium]|nr:hypothetical protein [Chitinivibrionales bacterium]